MHWRFKKSKESKSQKSTSVKITWYLSECTRLRLRLRVDEGVSIGLAWRMCSLWPCPSFPRINFSEAVSTSNWYLRDQVHLSKNFWSQLCALHFLRSVPVTRSIFHQSCAQPRRRSENHGYITLRSYFFLLLSLARFLPVHLRREPVITTSKIRGSRSADGILLTRVTGRRQLSDG